MKHFILALTIAILVAGLPSLMHAPAVHAAPAPFLYRPYYGARTLFSRSISMFDHDEPWYANDGKFVRFDGTTSSGSAVSNCQPYASCYDGHNGYDINMFYEPVLAAAGGTVIRAGWFNPSNHLDGGGLWVAIDHGNGYSTMYAHLSTILVTVGQQVSAQQLIATSGSSGSASGPHLHFSVFLMPDWRPVDPLGWQTNTFADPNVLPDYYMFVNNPSAPTQSPCLGCDQGASHAGATVVDDASGGFSTTGNWNTATGQGLINGSMRWTYTTNGSATATAAWQPTIPSDGWYEVGVYIDPINAGSQWANYTVKSLNSQGQPLTTPIWLDQQHVGNFQTAFGWINTGPQWLGIGVYHFAAGTSPNGIVTLSNATGEVNVQLGADAVEFVPV